MTHRIIDIFVAMMIVFLKWNPYINHKLLPVNVRTIIMGEMSVNDRVLTPRIICGMNPAVEQIAAIIPIINQTIIHLL